MASREGSANLTYEEMLVEICLLSFFSDDGILPFSKTLGWCLLASLAVGHFPGELSMCQD